MASDFGAVAGYRMNFARSVRPTSKPQLKSRWARFIAGLIVAAMVLAYFKVFGEQSIWVLFGIPFVAAGAAAVRAVVSDDEPSPPRGRDLEFRRGVLRQFADRTCTVEIDTTEPFEYRILGRFGLEEGLIRLYQEDQTLSFYTSDPGGLETVKDVLRIEWPPRHRHVSRSIGPPTA